jgi:cell division septation protein DedD
MPKNEKPVVYTSDSVTGRNRPLTPEETAHYAEKSRINSHGLYKSMEASGDLAGFKKDYPKGYAALKKLYDDHERIISTPEPKPAAKKSAAAKPAAAKPAAAKPAAAKPDAKKPAAAKPAAKPAAKKAAPAKKAK